jgi:hypothetical protein
MKKPESRLPGVVTLLENGGWGVTAVVKIKKLPGINQSRNCLTRYQVRDIGVYLGCSGTADRVVYLGA